MNRLLLTIALFASTFCLTCAKTPIAGTERPVPLVSDELLLNIARQYPAYGRVDDQSRLAPLLCAAPPPIGTPASVAPVPALSHSEDAATHGQKRFFLYARYPDEYLAITSGSQRPAYSPQNAAIAGTEPFLQILVKESFLSQPSANAALSADPSPFGPPQDLFMMVQCPPETPGTHHGWWFAVVTADHKTVKASGDIQSCIGCHDSAPHAYLFGLSKPDSP